MFNQEQGKVISTAIEIFRSLTEDCITDYEGTPAHAPDIVEMKAQLDRMGEIEQILKREWGFTTLAEREGQSQ